MAAKRGRIAHQEQLAPCAGHAHVHVALAMFKGRNNGCRNRKLLYKITAFLGAI